MKIDVMKKLVPAVAGICLSLFLGACATADKKPVTASAKDSGAGGAQLWTQNCARCHNLRTPTSYSDSSWEVAMLHMRIRANLTREEHEKILAFLKSAN
jgi:mono/diheme cytochrome c family protein